MEKAIKVKAMKSELPYVPQQELRHVMDCKDFSVSRETFSLFIDPEKELMMTWPQPGPDKLGAYYESSDYISHTDSSKNFMDKVYQVVKKFALKNKLGLVNRFSRSGKGFLLDVGCGTGDFLNVCQSDGWNVFGVEPNKKARTLAQKKSLDTKVLFESIQDLQSDSGQRFDVITLWHVLEHLPNLTEQIEGLKSLLKPDGILFVAVPNHKSYDANYYGPYWAAYDVPRHLWHFSRKSMHEIFCGFGMKVEKEFPMLFDSFYVSMLSEKYKVGKSSLINAFYRGLLSNVKAGRNGEYSSVIYLIKKAK